MIAMIALWRYLIFQPLEKKKVIEVSKSSIWRLRKI